MKIGLYFGSFNPIHVGHLIIANHVLNETTLDKVWFVISPQNPFKPSSSLLNEYDRLFLAQCAIGDNDQMKASDIEFSLPKPSYTAHTLAYLAEKFPSYSFEIIMGSDSFQNLPRWKNGEAIMAHHSIIVYKRPGFDIQDSSAAQLTIMNAPLLEISATHIRELIAAGKSIKYLVPDAVAQEIGRSRFYKKVQSK